jgi:protease-4
VTFYGTLDKLGVEAQFEGVGKYKTAPNQFTETGFTAPHREQMEALVSSLFEQYVQGVAEGRGLAAADVRALVDRGPFQASEAKEARLVDELLYRDQVEDRIPAAGRLDAARYVKSARSFFDGRPRLALVYAVGDLVPGESQTSPFGGGLAGSDTIVRGLRQARQDEAVRAIILRVDSPGGSGSAADAVWREVGIARRTKPVVVSMGDYAASGGYYIAMRGDAIVADPGTLTGSIGVFSGKFSLRGLYAKLGVSQETVRRGATTLFSSWSRGRRRAREGARPEPGVLRHVRGQGGRGRKKKPQEIEAVARVACGRGRRHWWSASSTRSAGSTPPSGWPARRPASPGTRPSRSS